MSISEKYASSTSFQKVAAVFAIACAVVSWVLTIAWANNEDTTNAYLGGLNFGEFLFNWHPVLMVTGMCLCAVCSVLSFRVIPLPKLAVVKPLHAILHTLAIISVCLGLVAVSESNNNRDLNPDDTLYPNMYSLHSFMGVAALILYFQNYLVGFSAFLIKELWGIQSKIAYMPYHQFLGGFSLIASAIAMETGIMELFAEFQCGYTVSEPDTNPSSNYHLLANGCIVMNGMSVMILLTLLFTLFALVNFPREASGKQRDSSMELSAALTENASQNNALHKISV
jgi:hypothetical protein